MTSGPVDPSLIIPQQRLPRAKTWREMRDRLWARMRGRLYQKDFDLAFDSVLRWLDAHTDCGLEQGRHSAHDFFVAMCGVIPLVTLQRCELTQVVLLTVSVKSADGQQTLSRTRTVTVTEPGDGSEAAAVPLQRKRA